MPKRQRDFDAVGWLRQQCLEAVRQAYRTAAQMVDDEIDHAVDELMLQWPGCCSVALAREARENLCHDPGLYQIPTKEAELLGRIASEYEVEDACMLSISKEVATQEAKHCQAIGRPLVCHYQFSWTLFGSWALRSAFFGEVHRDISLKPNICFASNLALGRKRTVSLMALAAIVVCGNVRRLPAELHLRETDVSECLMALHKSIVAYWLSGGAQMRSS